MHRGQPGAPPQGELDGGDVGEADHELRVRPDGVEVEPVDDALRSVTAPGADDSADRAVAQGRVEARQPLRVGAAEEAVLRVDVGAELDAEPPAGQQLGAARHPFGGGGPGGGDQHDRVSGLERGWTDGGHRPPA